MKRGAVLFLSLVAGACAEPPPPQASREVRDSAGVEIVTLPETDLPTWSVDSVPFLDIGTAEGKNGQDLSVPWASHRLADGRVAISNEGTNELRFYAPDGTFLKAVGREGKGPGEFGVIATFARGRGDTLVVADASNPWLTLVSPEGDFGRTVPLQAQDGRLPRLRGLVHDSMAVFRVMYLGRTHDSSRLARDTFAVFARPLDGGPIVDLGRFPSQEHFNEVKPSGSVSLWFLPMARDFYTAFADGLLWIGVSDTYDLRGYDVEAGRLVRIIRVLHPLVPVGDTEKQAYFDYHMAHAESSDQRQRSRQLHAMLEFPPTYPAFAALANDTEDDIWVEDYAPPWSGDAPAWRVYGADGTPLASVTTPRGVRIEDIGRDYVMGLWSDELGVEHIRAFRLHRGS